jgi:microcystin-dependent protein
MDTITIAAPAGIVAAFAGSTPPAGWLKCDGSAISRTKYAKLFAAIGGNYGTGDGSTTFNLPTQSVLPLGTSAPVSLTANGTLQIKNSVGGFENVVKSASGDSAARRELVVNADSNGQNGVVQYGSGITGTANLANATGAKAIVCIKY